MSHRYDLKQENKGAADAALDFPKLSLKKGEVARLALFSVIDGEDGKKTLGVPSPEGGYFFGIEKADGSYGGSYECLAPEEVKQLEEFDPEACPHCKAVLDGAPESIIQPRKRRFVLHVIRYKTPPGKSTLSTPHSVEVLAWTFTDRYFNSLVDENEKWSSGNTPGLLAHDITLTCEVEAFQTHKISVEPEAMWRADKELGKLVLATYRSGLELAPTLRRKLGSTLTKEQLETKINDALRSSGYGEGGAMVPPVDMAGIENLADDLFNTAVPAASAPEAVPAAEEVELPADPVAAIEDAPEAEAVTVPETADGDIDFDAFFDAK